MTGSDVNARLKKISIVENVLAVKVGVNLIPEERKHPDDVLSSLACSRGRKPTCQTYLVEKVGNGLCKPAVRPSAVNKHETREEAKLANSIIRGHDGCSTFDTSNTNTHVCFLNHGNIVGTIANSKGQAVQTGLDHVNYSSLLARTDTTA
jgi:hypothetical protein